MYRGFRYGKTDRTVDFARRIRRSHSVAGKIVLEAFRENEAAEIAGGEVDTVK